MISRLPKTPGENSGHATRPSTTVASIATDAANDLPRNQRALPCKSGSFSRMQPDRLPISLMNTPPRKAFAHECFFSNSRRRLNDREIVRRLWVRVPLLKIDTANVWRFPAPVCWNRGQTEKALKKVHARCMAQPGADVTTLRCWTYDFRRK